MQAHEAISAGINGLSTCLGGKNYTCGQAGLQRRGRRVCLHDLTLGEQPRNTSNNGERKSSPISGLYKR
jgi:hypothetical protein